MFAKTKTFNLMRTLEFGYFLSVVSFLALLFSSNPYVFLWGWLFFLIGCFLVTIDPRHLKEDWEVKEIEERWAEKKRIMTEKKRWEKEKKLRHMEAEHLQKQNGKAKH